MKSGMSMDQFLAEVARREESKADYVVSPRKMMVESDDATLVIEKAGSFKLNNIAHAQFAGKFDIPKKFYDELPSRVPGLRSTLVNGLMSADTERRMVRTLDGEARALVSDRFRPIDNFLVMQAILPVFAKHPDMEVVSLQLSDTRMYLQVVFPRIAGEVAVGDIVQSGVIITNSEVGMGSQDVRSIVWRLRCRNGMVGESIMRKYHVGRRVGDDDEDYSIYTDETIKAELKSFQLRLRDTLKSAITQANFNQQLSKLVATTKDELPPNVEGLVENVTKHYSLTKEEGKKVLSNLWKGKDNTRWGLVNAITAVAHDSDDPDRQYDMERTGHDLVVIGKHGWEELIKVDD